METFKNTTNAFSYTYERTLAAGETVFLKMPPVSPNKRGINDVGWLATDNIELSATLQDNPTAEGTMWQQILTDDEINKTVKIIKIVNTGTESGKVVIRAIFN